MNKSILLGGRRLSLLVFLGFGLVLLALRGNARPASQDPKPAPSPAVNQSTPTTPSPADNPSPATAVPQTEAQKKAAERKKRFEEQKALLDVGGGGSAAAGANAKPAAVDNDFYVNPVALNMLANETQEVHVWDMWNHDVSARVSWGLSNNGIVDMRVNRFATITAKMPGTTNVTARIDGHEIAAVVIVYRGEKLPWGVSRAVSAPPPRKTGGRRNTMTVTVEP
jgi:hypothetical protein